jgi:transcriptional regulator with XRE-family HTH domain
MPKTLKDFVALEIQRRQMSAREFGRFTQLSYQTINNILNEQELEPSIPTLIKLAEHTQTDLIALIRVAYPKETAHYPVSPEATIMAMQIERLPDPIRETITAIIRGTPVKS